ncbi:hypothetical protein BHYA_0003g01240 [Botrytis hyacinthi]|uniref:FAD linked oxidase N-terminal domain-containing protein n=1 Tax=Botrytis hyacinthi TaxID=278943 RepID=A0A4Z1H8M2_9HELO|nr:hypothetical protein BHYA_0003g01240 [Botrytis hyacinthi]
MRNKHHHLTILLPRLHISPSPNPPSMSLPPKRSRIVQPKTYPETISVVFLWPSHVMHLISTLENVLKYKNHSFYNHHQSNTSSICALGNLASYALNISLASDVTTSLKFAREYSIRLTIKNTGHDFFGRSTGAGSLAL